MNDDLLENFKKKLQSADFQRIEYTKHFYQRARRRNIDTDLVKNKLRNEDFVEVRKNNRSDPNFDFSYKVTVEDDNKRYEVPLYFNIPGTKILVKSVWPR